MLNEVLKLEVIDFDYEGLGICKLNDFPIFVKNALPKEIVTAVITKKTKNLAFADTLDILKKSPNRVVPMCQHYKECGGCSLMHMDYETELQFKKNKVINTLKKVGNIETLVHDVLPNINNYHYRNKVIMHVDRDIKTYRGFYKENTHDMVKIDECFIENKLVKEVADYFLKQLNEANYYVYKVSKKGIKSIMIRTSYINEMMIVVVTTFFDQELKNILIDLMSSFDYIKSTYININEKETNVVLGNKYILVAGQKELIEEINGIKYLVSPASFLQINNKQTKIMYQHVLKYAKLTKEDYVIDAYCGIGSISLALANMAKHVIGIEVVNEAIINANNNKILNGIENVTFICGKCEEEILKLKNKYKIDVIVFDPPRKGCEKTFLDAVIQMGIKRIVYVSCKVSTFARDAKYLIDNGYELKEVQPIDLFSKSPHVETVACLSLKDK